jgi:hypothetical protein
MMFNLRLPEEIMARIQGIDPKKTSFLMQQAFRSVRKIFGKDLTPQKISARVPRLFWLNTIVELLLGVRAKVPLRQRSIVSLRTAARVGCPF